MEVRRSSTLLCDAVVPPKLRIAISVWSRLARMVFTSLEVTRDITAPESSTIRVLYELLLEETSNVAVWSRMALSGLLTAWSTGATSVTRSGEELDIGYAAWAGMLLEVVRCAGAQSATEGVGGGDRWSKV